MLSRNTDRREDTTLEQFLQSYGNWIGFGVMFVAMFALHGLGMGGHGGHNHHPNKGEESAAREQDKEI